MAQLKIPGIYKIQSICKPERFYIGSAMNLRKRKYEHFHQLQKNKHYNRKLQNHYNKYGKDDLIFIVIEPCFPEYLLIREQYYINHLKPYFNICKIAGNLTGVRLGVRLTEETKKKISEKHKGKVAWNKGKEGKKGTIPWNKGIKLSEKIKCKFKLRKRRGPLSDEERERISLLNKGKRLNNETKQKIRNKHLGMKYSDETNAKKARRGNNNGMFGKYRYGEENPMFGRKHSQNTKDLIAQKAKGRKASEETLKKFSKRSAGENNPMYGVHRFGKDNPNYKHGKYNNKLLKQEQEIIRLLERDINDPRLNIFKYEQLN